jgi:hypothetical protein
MLRLLLLLIHSVFSGPVRGRLLLLIKGQIGREPRSCVRERCFPFLSMAAQLIQADPKHWRRLEAEARVIALTMSDSDFKRVMLTIADSYRRIAERAESGQAQKALLRHLVWTRCPERNLRRLRSSMGRHC